MNRPPGALDRTVCTLIRLGQNATPTNSSSTPSKNFLDFYEQSGEPDHRLPPYEQLRSVNPSYLQSQSSDSDYVPHHYSQSPPPRPEPPHSLTTHNSLFYEKDHDHDHASFNLSPLMSEANYWDQDTYDKPSEPNSGLSPFDGFAKSSPSIDQGYHTLNNPRQTLPAPIWSSSAIYKGKKYQTKSNCFDRLPDDLVVKIFSYLTSLDLSHSAQVCRRFDTLAWTPCLWRVILLENDSVSGDRAIRGVLRQLCGQGTTGACPSVERVQISDGVKISDKTLSLLARRCPELTHLQLQGCTNVNNADINEIATRCNNLQHLDLTGCMKISCISINSGPEPPRKMQLQYLDLTDCVQLQDSGLKIIVWNCPLLAYLYLRRCIQITDGGINFVPSFCPGLRELSLSDCSNITDFGLYELAKLGSTLRYLSVAKCHQVSDAGIKAIAKRCYKLRYLNARGCEAVSDYAITVLAQSCTRLRALDIGICDVSDAGLRKLAESCPNLKKLSLRNCDLVTDRGVQYVAYYCRGLQQLNIQDCQISLEGYRAVKRYCKKCIIEHTNPGFF